jgi:hypothetical protein
LFLPDTFSNPSVTIKATPNIPNRFDFAVNSETKITFSSKAIEDIGTIVELVV